MTVYAATKNPGKLRELQQIFARGGWDIRSDPLYEEVEEHETSYVGNAALKARALRRGLLARGRTAPVLGDDSGLEVQTLCGRPGVLSARYGGPTASWADRRAKLLGELAANSDRRARFVCALHYIASDGREFAVAGEYAGSIAERERGDGGFSYDAIFIGEDGRTFAEISESEKNRVSHRARAAQALLGALHEAQVEAGRDDRT